MYRTIGSNVIEIIFIFYTLLERKRERERETERDGEKTYFLRMTTITDFSGESNAKNLLAVELSLRFNFLYAMHLNVPGRKKDSVNSNR